MTLIDDARLQESLRIPRGELLIDADGGIAHIGLQPETALAEHHWLPVDHGVLADEGFPAGYAASTSRWKRTVRRAQRGGWVRPTTRSFAMRCGFQAEEIGVCPR